MIEFLPYFLIVLSWDPASTAGPQLVENSLFPSQETCELEGHMYATVHEDVSQMEDEHPLRYSYYCVSAPSGEDVEAVFQRIGPSK